MSNYKAVIFDLDGTLVDSMDVWNDVDKIFLTKRGFDVPDDLFAHMKSGDSFLAMAHHFKQKFHLKDSIDEICNEWNSLVVDYYSQLELNHGADALIYNLIASGFKLGLGTSNSAVLTNAALEHNGIKDVFSSIVTGCLAERGKPFPDIYLEVAKELNVNPAECIVIEDSSHGLQAARNAHMTTVAIEYKKYDNNSKKEIENLSDYYVKDYVELNNLLFTKLLK